MRVDFSDIGSVISRMGFLSSGLHTAAILEYKEFEDSGRLYFYMQTDGVRHRESFMLAKGLIFLKLFLVSAGVPEEKLNGPIDNFESMLDKIVGRTVYFNYQRPELDSDGKKVQGSYPKYSFYPKKQYEMMVAARTPAATQAAVADIVTEEPKEETVPAASTASTTTQNNGSSSDFDFLLDDG
jgi:hypothetical protein